PDLEVVGKTHLQNPRLDDRGRHEKRGARSRRPPGDEVRIEHVVEVEARLHRLRLRDPEILGRPEAHEVDVREIDTANRLDVQNDLRDRPATDELRAAGLRRAVAELVAARDVDALREAVSSGDLARELP